MVNMYASCLCECDLPMRRMGRIVLLSWGFIYYARDGLDSIIVLGFK